MQTKSIFVLGLIIILGGGLVWMFSSSPSDDAMMEDTPNIGDTMMADDEAVSDPNMVGGDAMMEGAGGSTTEGDTMMKDEGDAMEGEGAMMEKKGTYEHYSSEKLALASSGKVLLFFHAPWCPVCRAIEAEINAGATIPSGIHILKVDYDTAIALRQKYGVTMQHTFVQVDSAGDLIQKFSDASALAIVFARVK